MANDLVIKISGDIKNFQDALDKAQKKTEDLSEGLATAAKVSGVAFAALTAEIALSVSAYAESEKVTNELTRALQNQGIYSKELLADYQRQATALQNLTGVSDEAVLSAQKTIQAYLGQIEVTDELTTAIADFAAAQGVDLASAAQTLGKAIEGNVGALSRYGVKIDEGITKNERIAQVIEQVTGKFGGQAEAAGKGLGAISKMTEAFGDLQEEIGRRFAPAIEVASNFLAKMFNTISQSKALTDLVVSVVAAGTVVSALVLGVSAGGLAFLKLKAALEAAKIATSAMSLAVKGLVGATGIGLLLVLVSEIYLNWNAIWPRMQATFQSFVNNIGVLGAGLQDILYGIFTLNKDRIKQGLAEVKAAFQLAAFEYNDALDKSLKDRAKIEDDAEAEQKRKNDKNAKERARLKAEQEQREIEASRAALELQVLQQDQASSELIALKKAEADALKLVADEKYEGDKEALIARAEELRELQEEQRALDQESKKQYEEEILANNEEFQALSEEQQALFIEQNKARAIEQTESERSAQLVAAKTRQDDQIKANNTFLQEQIKYGTAYATINRIMHSEVLQGTKQAVGEMIQFQQSSNATLKAIGKAAAITDIIIKTAQSAMNIYNGFSAIPIVGVALGVAGAAAAVAFGAEQIGKVTGAAEGGIMTGGIAGVDSIPVMAQRGELISPTANFEEVIGSVRAAREAERVSERLGDPVTQGGGQGSASVLIGFDGKEASQVLTVRQVEDRSLGTSQDGSFS